MYEKGSVKLGSAPPLCGGGGPCSPYQVACLLWYLSLPLPFWGLV